MISTFYKLYLLLKKKEIRYFYFLQLLNLISAFLEILSIFFVATFFDIILNDGIFIKEKLSITNIYFSFFDKKTDLILNYCYLLIIFFIFNTYLNIFTIFKTNIFVQKLGARFGSELYNFYIYQNYLYFSKVNSSNILKKITIDIDRFADKFFKPFLVMINKTILCFFIFIILLLYNFNIALMLIFILPSLYLICYFFLKKTLVRSDIQFDVSSKSLYHYLTQSFQGIKEVIFYDNQKFLSNKIKESFNIKGKQKAIQNSSPQTPKFIIELFAMSSVFLYIIFLVYNNKDLNIIIPTLSLYVFAGYKLLPALQAIYVSFADCKASVTSFNNFKDELDLNNKIDLISNFDKKISYKNYIKFKNIFFKYPDNTKYLFNDLDFEIKKNSNVAIIGKTGSGKSTIADLLLGFVEPESGQILIDGEKICKENLKDWKKNIGYVPQNIFFLNDSIESNIKFGNILNKSIDLKKIYNLSMVDEFYSQNNNELIIGELGKRLSGGQKQRVGIARALYRAPEILIFDEATNALDVQTEKKIIENILNEKSIKTFICITHNINLIKYFDNIIFIDEGLIHHGTRETLSKFNQNFKKIFDDIK